MLSNIKKCEICSYSCKYECDMIRHLQTDKHKKNIETINKNNQNNNKIKCICGKQYSHKNGYYFHRKTCEMNKNTNDNENNNNIESKNFENIMNLHIDYLINIYEKNEKIIKELENFISSHKNP